MGIAARRTRQGRSAISADTGWAASARRDAETGAPAHEFEALDSGRLLVHRQFSPVLKRNGIATFDALFQFSGGQCVRRVHNRSTTRIAVYDRIGWHSFYLKRHAAPPWGECVRPLLNLGRPIFGARNEWHAIISLHEAGVPTLTPVAFGEVGERSLLLTDDLRTDLELPHFRRGSREPRPHDQRPDREGARGRRRRRVHGRLASRVDPALRQGRRDLAGPLRRGFMGIDAPSGVGTPR